MSRIRMLGTAILLALTGSALAATPAYAHVSVTPDTAVAGEYTQVSFRVPNERDDAATVKLEVAFPADRPLSSVSVGDVPGWTSTVHKEKLPAPVRTEDGEVTEAITSITWEGGRIEPDHFQEFPVRLGKLEAGTLTFKALQTYSSGEVVRWIETAESGPEPEHPAPALTVATPPAPPAPASESSSDVLARVLGGVGLAVGVVALAWRAIPRNRSAEANPAAGTKEKDTTKVGV